MIKIIVTLKTINLKYSKPKEIPVVFHNESNFDYHYIIKELAKEFERKFSCFEENTRKYKTSSVPTRKEVKRIDKTGKETAKTISHILQFFDSARYMISPLSNLVVNLAKDISKLKCKYGHDNETCEAYRIKYQDCECCLE